MKRKRFETNLDNVKVMRGFFDDSFSLSPLKQKNEDKQIIKYRNVLPLDTDSTVHSQFGFTPLSVIEPTKQSKQKWEAHHAYLDVMETRRGDDCKYLPGLNFSEFHAGLAENIIRYWSMENDLIIDPFCGRATRAIVSASLKRRYIGFEVSKSTFERVTKRVTKLGLDDLVKIKYKDGCQLEGIKKNSCDFSFTCPPYYNIETYEEGENQLSRLDSYPAFLKQIAKCIANTYEVLKYGKFCCWVVADFRYKGELVDFTFDCLRLFKRYGFTHWDTIIIKNISPFASMQIGKVAAKRYTSKIHETLLVFRKLD